MTIFRKGVQKTSVILRYGLGVIFLLVGLMSLASGEYFPSLFILLLAFLVTPLSNKFLFNKLKWRVPTWTKIVIGIVLLIGFGMTTSPTLAIEVPGSSINKSPITVGIKYSPGKTVKLYQNGKEIGEKQTSENGKATFENIELSKGENTFKAEVIDDNTNKTTSRKVIYDTTPPDKPQVANLPYEVNNKNLHIQGTAEPNATIKIFFNGNEARNIRANSKGEFSAKFLLSRPENSFAFEAIDEAGNSSGLTEKIEVAYIDKKEIAKEKKVQQKEEQIKKELTEAEATKAKSEKSKQEQKENFTDIYERSKNLFELSDRSNELVAASLQEYSALRISRATLYSRVKDAETAQDRIWQGLVDLGNQPPGSLKEYEKEITGFDGAIVYLQVAVKLRREAMGELAKYIDTSSLQNMRNYETKLNENTSYALNGFIKLQSVGNKLGVEIE